MSQEAKNGKHVHAYRKNRNEWLPGHAADLFRIGADTLQIGHHFAISEQTILRWITNERCQRLNLPNPYQGVKG